MLGYSNQTQKHAPPAGCACNFGISYTYDLMGNMLTSQDPYMNAFTYGYNSAGRAVSLTGSLVDSQDPGNLLSAMKYSASGQPVSDTLGDGETETFTYDNRLRLKASSSVLGSTPIYNYSLSFAPNSNILTANDSVNSNWNYSYDQFNRLICASVSSNTACAMPPSGTPTYTYVYDRFGNRWQQNSPAGSVYTSSLSFTGNNPSSPANNNRVDVNSTNGANQYDAAGNLLFDGAHHYWYDAENHLIQVDGTLPFCTSNGASGSAATACYYYDASGRRVYRTGYTNDSCDATGKRGYVFDLAGHVIVEANSGSTDCVIQVYLGERHFGRQGGVATSFYHSDWLGTVRLVNTDTNPASGAETCTSLPFGDGLTCNSNYLNVWHFTGKERDAESGLDNFGARYDSSSMGRFMTPDSTAYVKPINPQSWNLYAYARNNPLLYVDPTGNTVSLANCQDKNKCVQVLTNAAQLPKGVTAEADKNGNLVLKGDLSKIKGGNAARLLQLVQSDKTANFWIGDTAPKLGGGTKDFGGGASGTTNQGYNQNYAVVQADPSKVDSDDLRGVFLSPDGSTTTGDIPGADIEEAAAHELLGHVWADLIGGQAAGTNGNKREALIAEDRVRNTDPARGLKIRHQGQPESIQLIRTTDLPRITNPGSQP